MRAGIVCCVILLGPLGAAAAERELPRGENSDQRARALDALKRKLAEAEKLEREIECLRKATMAPGQTVGLRVRVFEASLEKIKALGTSLPHGVEGAAEVEEQLTSLLAHPHVVARLIADESLSIIEGTEGRVRAGAEFTAEQLIQAQADPARFAFHGTEVGATPKTEEDGRLSIELDCRHFSPILHSDLGPQLRIGEISAVVKLAPNEAVVLDGAKEERLEKVAAGVSLSGRAVRQTVNHIQTFVVVSRH